MRRGFKLTPGERVLIVEDVVTRGGRVLECIEIIRQAGGVQVAVAFVNDLVALHRGTLSGHGLSSPVLQAASVRGATNTNQ